MPRFPTFVRSIALVAFVLCGGSALARTQETSPEVRTDELRAALVRDGARAATAARLRGHAELFGETLEFSLLFDPRGKFLFETHGSMEVAIALDGDGGWERDLSGAIWKSELSGLERSEFLLWVMSGRWIAPSSGAHLRLLDSHAADAKTYGLTLANAIVEASVEVDDATHLPKRMTIPDPQGDATVEFSKWSDGPGELWPHHVVQREGTGSEMVLDFEAVEPMPSFVVDPFRFNDALPDDVHFADGAPTAIEVERAPSGHLFVKPVVDGHDLGWFILDSGAGMQALSKSSSTTLGLEHFGTRYVIGAGGKAKSSFVRAAKLELGPATVDRPTFIEIDTDGLSKLFARPIAGIIGADFFRRATVEIDFAAPSVMICDPAKFELTAGRWTPARFNHRHPCVEAKFEGERSGLFVLDTGSGSEVLFHSPAVESLKLLDGRETTAVSLSGLGGAQTARAGKLQWLELAGRRFESLDAQFATVKTGALSDLATVGVLGGKILKSRKLVLDYPHSRVAFVERAK